MWLGVGLVVPALALGCRQSRSYTGGAEGGVPYTPPMIGAAAPARGPGDAQIVDMQVVPPPTTTLTSQH
jgi:hypothetical protein